MSERMSAIEKLTDYIEETVSAHNFLAGYARDARAELAALRARVEQAERERDEARAQLAQADALAASATLTPRRCGTCAQEAARKMRDNAHDAAYVLYASRDILNAIDALPLPSCEGCNPLKPESTHE